MCVYLAFPDSALTELLFSVRLRDLVVVVEHISSSAPTQWLLPKPLSLFLLYGLYFMKHMHGHTQALYIAGSLACSITDHTNF